MFLNNGFIEGRNGLTYQNQLKSCHQCGESARTNIADLCIITRILYVCLSYKYLYLLSSLEGEHFKYVRCWMDVFRLKGQKTITSLVDSCCLCKSNGASEASPQMLPYRSI